MTLRIAITGSSGLIGTALIESLSRAGHSITRIIRESGRNARGAGVPAQIIWDPVNRRIDRASLESHDIVIHLAGESIAAGRWTAPRKVVIRESRIRGTTLLAENLAALKRPPRMLLSASAIGYYGNRNPEEIVTEETPPGSGFLRDLCRDWERATDPAKAAGVRVVHLRFGIVLSSRGGALAKMLLPFQLGLGGKIGSGRQIMSWIALEEIPSVVLHLIKNDGISGPVNVVSPNPVSNADFTTTLGRVLKRPTVAPLPAFAARLLFGEMAGELLLGGARVIPKKLTQTNYVFKFPELDHTLAHMLA
ncbi:MAG: TIGR01777 family oxidoreductase [Nitrospirota bacterium]